MRERIARSNPGIMGPEGPLDDDIEEMRSIYEMPVLNVNRRSNPGIMRPFGPLGGDIEETRSVYEMSMLNRTAAAACGRTRARIRNAAKAQRAFRATQVAEGIEGGET